METQTDTSLENAVKEGTRLTAAIASRGISFEESQRNYNEFAQVYDKTMETLGRKAHVFVADNVCASFRRDEYRDIKILDVGAGTGLVGQELKSRGFMHIDAVEPNECMLNKAREHSVYEKYFLDYLKAGPSIFEADSYDVITGCGIFAESAHVPCEALNEMIRIVKPGGYIVLAARLSVLEREGEASQLEMKMEELEREKKWKMVVRERVSTYNSIAKQPGLIWKFEVA